MAHFTSTIECTGSPEAIFNYMADFSNAAQWDPTVTRIRKGRGDVVGLGARYEVFLGTRVTELSLDYRTTRYEPNRCIVFEAETSFLRSLDTIEVEETERGCLVHYDADLRLFGAAAIFDLPVHWAFQGSGRQSLRGLEEALAKIA